MGHWLGEYIKLNYLADFFLFVQLLNEMNNFLRLNQEVWFDSNFHLYHRATTHSHSR